MQRHSVPNGSSRSSLLSASESSQSSCLTSTSATTSAKRSLKSETQRDRERSEMEGRIAAQMERSNNISEGLQAAMESLRASTAALHDEIRESREHSHDMANKVDHIYEKES